MFSEIAVSRKTNIREKCVLEYGFIMPANQCKKCLNFYKKLWLKLTHSLSSTVHCHVFSKKSFQLRFFWLSFTVKKLRSSKTEFRQM